MMQGEKPSLAATLRQLLADRDAGTHVAIERLAAYRAGNLSPADEEHVREHLLACRECSDLLLDLAAFPDLGPAPGHPPISDDEVAAAWRDLEPLVRAGKLEIGGQVVPLRSETASSLRRAYALAALLAVAVAGLLFWGLSLRSRVENLSAPRLGTVAADLVPIEETRSLEEGGIETVTPENGRVSVRLYWNQPEASYASYGVEVESAGGDPVWAGQVPEGKLRGSLNLDLPQEMMPPGKYQIVLYGMAAGERTKLADYAFEVVD